MQKSKFAFRRAAILALFLVMSLTVIQANAAITTFSTRAAFDAAFSGALVETWDTFSDPTVISNGSTISGITYNLVPGIGSGNPGGSAMVTGGFQNTTEPNALGATGLGYFDSVDAMTFSFLTPLTAFGIDINASTGFDGAFQATTNLNDVALSFYDAFPTSPFFSGLFLGFSSTNPFSSVTIALGPNGDPLYDAFTLDTMRMVEAQPVPLPPSLLLLGSGLVGLGFMRRKFKAWSLPK